MALPSLLVHIQRTAAHIFHRVSCAGPPVPAHGPLLLVANHQNSLLDPALLQVAAERPVRFLAKAPLFRDPVVGPLVRASGSIPVYRRQDGDVPPGANEGMFRAVHDQLASGAAIGLFPEGISHDQPRLAPLRTGAARIALGAVASGVRLPIIPVGIVIRERGIFRSEVLLVRGAPVEWDDLADRGEEDAEAVRELTARIADSIDGLIVSYEDWADQPQVELIDRILRAARIHPRDDSDPEAQVARWREIATSWSTHRASSPGTHILLERALRQHGRRLRVLRLTPIDLGVATDWHTAVRWAFRRIPLALLGVATLAGAAVAWIPYRLTGILAARRSADRDDMMATVKALMGGVLFIVWTLIWTAVAGIFAGRAAALFTLLMVPALSLLALWSGEGWRAAWRDTRRFMLIRRHRARVSALVEEQAQLAELLRAQLPAAAAAAGIRSAEHEHA